MVNTATKFKLPSGHDMPLIGCKLSKINMHLLQTPFLFAAVGTFQIRGRDLIRSVLDYALEAGYRSIGMSNECYAMICNASNNYFRHRCCVW